MANTKRVNTGNQNEIEKKDLPLRATRSNRRGSDAEDNFNDEDQARAKGERTGHGQPGRSAQGVSAPQPAVRDNTRPGGNRPKGREKHGNSGGLDHD